MELLRINAPPPPPPPPEVITESSQDQHEFVWGAFEISAVVGMVIFLCTIFLGVPWYFLKYKKKNGTLQDTELDEFFNGAVDDESNLFNQTPYVKGVWEVDEDNFHVCTCEY